MKINQLFQGSKIATKKFQKNLEYVLIRKVSRQTVMSFMNANYSTSKMTATVNRMTAVPGSHIISSLLKWFLIHVLIKQGKVA